MKKEQLIKQINEATDAAGGAAPDVWYLSLENYWAISKELKYPQEEMTLMGVKLRMAQTPIGGVWDRHVKQVPFAQAYRGSSLDR